jgi:hypothetical protein
MYFQYILANTNTVMGRRYVRICKYMHVFLSKIHAYTSSPYINVFLTVFLSEVLFVFSTVFLAVFLYVFSTVFLFYFYFSCPFTRSRTARRCFAFAGRAPARRGVVSALSPCCRYGKFIARQRKRRHIAEIQSDQVCATEKQQPAATCTSV